MSNGIVLGFIAPEAFFSGILRGLSQLRKYEQKILDAKAINYLAKCVVRYIIERERKIEIANTAPCKYISRGQSDVLEYQMSLLFFCSKLAWLELSLFQYKTQN